MNNGKKEGYYVTITTHITYGSDFKGKLYRVITKEL